MRERPPPAPSHSDSSSRGPTCPGVCIRQTWDLSRRPQDSTGVWPAKTELPPLNLIFLSKIGDLLGHDPVMGRDPPLCLQTVPATWDTVGIWITDPWQQSWVEAVNPGRFPCFVLFPLFSRRKILIRHPEKSPAWNLHQPQRSDYIHAHILPPSLSLFLTHTVFLLNLKILLSEECPGIYSIPNRYYWSSFRSRQSDAGCVIFFQASHLKTHDHTYT